MALGLAYDGSAWQGWQTQPHRQTVQDTLEAALARFCDVPDPVPTICAGRTDTGVHAAMQVIHLDTALDRRTESWVRGVNAFLPPTISVQWAQRVSGDFHARFSARSRTYVYLLFRGRVRPALWAGRAGWSFHPLDVDAMRKAAQVLLGEHDFSSFRSSQCQAAHPVRVLRRLDIAERGPFLVFTLQANAFLHHMVRNIMGALLQIGQGREPVSWMTQLLAARDRRQGAPTFAPDGLYLSAIEYPPEFGLRELDGAATLLSPFTQS
ncbi:MULTISPECIES: tRNA pseudouridine(38-40) synthase TruA [unclassified Achromobacter]|uniref:tRNA pseudouridine(38-40) synthase TruA n=1 Tax=unclassified Achromobacter TaxID=2626865 RepID=UPI00069D9DD7|nr:MULTISPECIES: tRNA pseudouridine(38-40) synthase TruA [unclassified Achromobacter]KOF52251.1 tRNA pseudouridine synthase A [Achromobacter sp. DMS1]KOF54105.1 tRNA pseudouridine synthase A [Achromobacter sp. DMS1]